MGALALAALVSCSDEDAFEPRQNEINGSQQPREHNPGQLSDQDAAQSLDIDTPF